MKSSIILADMIRKAVETAVMQIITNLRGMTVEQIVEGEPAEQRRDPNCGISWHKVKPTTKPPKPPLSLARRKALKIQGTYIGLLRNFTGKERKAMQKLAEKDRNAAITKMRKLVKAR